MDKHRLNIVIIEPSHIVFEGLSTLLLKMKPYSSFFWLRNLDEFITIPLKEKLNIAIVNPVVIQNRLKEFARIKRSHPGLLWLGLIYSYFDDDLLKNFDDIISISDSTDFIIKKLDKSSRYNDCNDNDTIHEKLSERETEVLVLLIKGLSNKEIADKLNISIHTVISHRKNIIEKTGIKSLSGLTIFAIAKKIIPIDISSL